MKKSDSRQNKINQILNKLKESKQPKKIRLYEKLFHYKVVLSELLPVYTIKFLLISLYSFMILLILHLFSYRLTFINFLSSISIYFLIQEIADYFMKLVRGNKQ